MNGARRGMVVGLVLLVAAVAAPLAIRWGSEPRGPSLTIHSPGGATRTVGLAALRRLPQVVRHGEVQNQFGNWKDPGIYQGVLVTDLLPESSYATLEAVARDGYRVSIDRTRVEDPEYPLVLAYAMDGVSVPAWKDGFRLVVLPEGGRVGNEEYDTASAGSFWVRNVDRLVLH